MYKFSRNSLKNLEGIHPNLVNVCVHALSMQKIDFGVIKNSFRTVEQQKENMRKGLSKTMDSLHLPQSDGYSHAVDLFWYKDGIDVFKLERSPNISSKQIDHGWNTLTFCMYQAAIKYKIPLGWGGFWKGAWDKPHYYILRDREK
jgi:peptidoglycan L-alanyl-D-glutamate endopeptidase CwlK